ncbi:hypothetical protein [Streptosporangium subroseum]|nr:hypothetical protein OHB15_19885 [Streptosporangium subroseum]
MAAHDSRLTGRRITAMPVDFDLPGMGAEVVGEVIWHAEHNHQVKIRLTP